jgi:hypothetical protein
VKEAAGSNLLPEYGLAFDANTDQVTFARR